MIDPVSFEGQIIVSQLDIFLSHCKQSYFKSQTGSEIIVTKEIKSINEINLFTMKKNPKKISQVFILFFFTW